ALVKVAPSNLLSLRVDIAGDEASVVGEAFGHHQSAVPGEHSDFEYAAGTRQANEHLKELAFDAADLHLGVGHVAVGFVAEAAKNLGLGGGMIVGEMLDVVTNEFTVQ